MLNKARGVLILGRCVTSSGIHGVRVRLSASALCLTTRLIRMNILTKFGGGTKFWGVYEAPLGGPTWRHMTPHGFNMHFHCHQMIIQACRALYLGGGGAYSLKALFWGLFAP